MNKLKAVPVVSIIMPVFNGARFLEAAIRSIVAQTYSNFELLVLDDGSTDESCAIVERAAEFDPRIRFIKNERNEGLTVRLLQGVQLANGTLIARMDSDDISLPTRFAEQVAFLACHDDVGVCGSWAVHLSPDDSQSTWRYPVTHESILARLIFENALVHSSVMMRTSLLRNSVTSYDPSTRYAQDYDLWTRLILATRFANLPRELVIYRTHSAQVGRLYAHEQEESVARIQQRFLAHLGVQFCTQEMELHSQLKKRLRCGSIEDVRSVRVWLEKILLTLRDSVPAARQAVAREVLDRWFKVCRLRAPSTLSFFIESIVFLWRMTREYLRISATLAKVDPRR